MGTLTLTGSIKPDKPAVGDTLTAYVYENVWNPDAKIAYEASDGWAVQSQDSHGAVLTRRADRAGDVSLTVKASRPWQSQSDTLTLKATVAGPDVRVPGAVPGKVVVGMATDDFAARAAETGKVGADHFFRPSWDPAGFLKSVQTAKGRGLYAFGNMKTGSWAAAAKGSLDASLDKLVHDLDALAYPCHICFHHEPGFKTPGGQGDAGTGFEWRDMNIRLLNRVKQAGSKWVTPGIVDNGFKWSPNISGMGWTDAEIDQIYTDAFLSALEGCSLGADFYDGATTRSNGDPAAHQVARADAWATTRGWGGAMAIGEFSFVRPGDADLLWQVVKANPARWWCILAFDSDDNNRLNIPTKGAGWNFTHDFDTAHDRLDAFKAILADPLSQP
jgi:hypothetical protein